MSTRIRYHPPVLQETLLIDKVLEKYPAHKKQPELIQLLVHEYKKLWWLVLSYSGWRIVAPGCILAVQHAHQELGRRQYFEDSVSYFERYVPHQELAWAGYTDVRGTLDTLHAYSEMFRETPNIPWTDIVTAHKDILSGFKKTKPPLILQ